MEHYGGIYPDNAAWVHTVASNLEVGTAGWLVSLHEAGAQELGDLDAFIQIL